MTRRSSVDCRTDRRGADPPVLSGFVILRSGRRTLKSFLMRYRDTKSPLIAVLRTPPNHELTLRANFPCVVVLDSLARHTAVHPVAGIQTFFTLCGLQARDKKFARSKKKDFLIWSTTTVDTLFLLQWEQVQIKKSS